MSYRSSISNENKNRDSSKHKNKSFMEAFDKFNTNCTENMLTKMSLSSSSTTTTKTTLPLTTTTTTKTNGKDRRADWSKSFCQQQLSSSTRTFSTVNDSTMSLMTNTSCCSSSSSDNNDCCIIVERDDWWTVDSLFTINGRPNQYVGGYSPEWIAMQRRRT
jgi:hypothetical protein